VARHASLEKRGDPEAADGQGSWWDRRDEPPRVLTATLDRASGAIRDLLRPADDPGAPADSRRARIIQTALLALTFLIVVWLLLTAFVEQT
jgi:hypothetical protein